jgi:hypothetical protein
MMPQLKLFINTSSDPVLSFAIAYFLEQPELVYITVARPLDNMCTIFDFLPTYI